MTVSDKTNFYLNQEEPNKSCLLAMQSIVLAYHPEINETVKYGMPCFTYQGKALLYLWTDKKTQFPYYLFVEGNQMSHPKLESGDRKRMKTYSVNPNKDLDLEEIQGLIQAAMNIQSDKTKS